MDFAWLWHVLVGFCGKELLMKTLALSLGQEPHTYLFSNSERAREDGQEKVGIWWKPSWNL